jgi:hypothetical protein
MSNVHLFRISMLDILAPSNSDQMNSVSLLADFKTRCKDLEMMLLSDIAYSMPNNYHGLQTDRTVTPCRHL